MMDRGALLSPGLEYFSILYRTLDYAQAARAIPMSYQGLKKAIINLESSLGVPLFERNEGGNLIPTHYAQLLNEHMLAWNQDATTLRKQFMEYRSTKRRTIDIAMAQGVFGFLGYDAADDFARRYPSLGFDVIEYQDIITDKVLAAGDYDLAITVSPFDPDFDTVPLASLNFTAWVNDSHPFASRKNISFDNLEGEAIMVNGLSNKMPMTLSAALETRGVHPKALYTTSELIYVVMFALDNKGVGIGVEHFDKGLCSNSRVTSIPFEGMPEWTIGLSKRRGYNLDAGEKTLCEYLRLRADERPRSLKSKTHGVEDC